MNYYQILEVERNATIKEIKKHYYKLAKKYHPDKNSGNKDKCEDFKLLSEAYSTLSNPKKRYLYDVKLDYDINENYDLHFTEEDYELLHSYYEKFMNSVELKFIKILYKSLPLNIKEKMKNKLNNIINKKKSNDLVYENIKTIDSRNIIYDYVINLCLKFTDIYNNNLKKIKIVTDKKIYILFITNYNYKIKIKIDNVYLIINILGDLKDFRVKNYDLIFTEELNLYQYYYSDYFRYNLDNNNIVVKNNKNNNHIIKNLGLKDPITGKRGDFVILFDINIDKNNIIFNKDKKLINDLFNI